MYNEETINSVIRSRANRILDQISVLTAPDMEFYLAGGALSGDNFNDIDIFPKDGFDLKKISEKCPDIISKTKNALTVRVNGKIVQFCNYTKSSLVELVYSFDYAHIQVGVSIKDGRVKEIYASKNFKIAKTIENSEYTGSEYPLSSLIRILKYYKREKITKSAAIRSIISIVKDINKRGFKDYEDFKDQIDAVDLGLVPEEIEDMPKADLFELYELLVKNK